MRLSEAEIRKAMKVKKGDLLHIQPLWNRTERKENQIPIPAKCEDVIFPVVSQSRVAFVVKSKGGRYRQLDAAWFIITVEEQGELWAYLQL